MAGEGEESSVVAVGHYCFVVVSDCGEEEQTETQALGVKEAAAALPDGSWYE